MLCDSTEINSLSESSPTSLPATKTLQHARELLTRYQLIDGHLDTPQIMRVLSRSPIGAIPRLESDLPGHFDLQRARKGGLGGAFFTVWTPCPQLLDIDVGDDFLNPDNTVRDTLESIDLIREMIVHHPALQLATTADEAEEAFRQDRIAALIGMEGSHMLGNSLATIRILARLGVRYLTLTHLCHTAFATSAGGGTLSRGSHTTSPHPNNGLSSIGRDLVRELNRLGVMVDLSHVSDEVMLEVLEMTNVPVIFSHSGARHVYDHPRNVPDEVLRKMGPGKNEGVIVFYAGFIAKKNATVSRVADHVDHIASMTSRRHVGLASDFDGIDEAPEGLEDVTRWPYLIAEFISRGWSDEEIAGLMGGNLLRAMRRVEQAKEDRARELPSSSIYEARSDLPAVAWGGPGGCHLPAGVKRELYGSAPE